MLRLIELLVPSTGILISSSSQPVVRKNRVFGGRAAGIEVTNSAGTYV